jgi:hypothetical protein
MIIACRTVLASSLQVVKSIEKSIERGSVKLFFRS